MSETEGNDKTSSLLRVSIVQIDMFLICDLSKNLRIKIKSISTYVAFFFNFSNYAEISIKN